MQVDQAGGAGGVQQGSDGAGAERVRLARRGLLRPPDALHDRAGGRTCPDKYPMAAMADQKIDYIHCWDDGPMDGSRGKRRPELRCTTMPYQEPRNATA